jgi:hypothetical protein
MPSNPTGSRQLASEYRTIKHGVTGDVDEAHVSWEFVALLNHNDVSGYQIQG